MIFFNDDHWQWSIGFPLFSESMQNIDPNLIIGKKWTMCRENGMRSEGGNKIHTQIHREKMLSRGERRDKGIHGFAAVFGVHCGCCTDISRAVATSFKSEDLQMKASRSAHASPTVNSLMPPPFMDGCGICVCLFFHAQRFSWSGGDDACRWPSTVLAALLLLHNTPSELIAGPLAVPLSTLKNLKVQQLTRCLL